MIAKYMSLNLITLLNFCLAWYILLQQRKQWKISFFILLPNVYLVFLKCSIVKLPQKDITKLQLLITIEFTLTKYKIQGPTFYNAVFDLKCLPRGNTAMHRKFCFTYIQLFWFCIFNSLDLLQIINMKDINNQLYLQIYNKDLRLDNMSHMISDKWKQKIKVRIL